MPRWGGIEAGGTKFVCALATDEGQLLHEITTPTTSPEETIQKAIAFFRAHHWDEPLAGVGIGTFGPADLDLQSPTYGYITTTPKPGWADTDMVGPLQEALGIPVGFSTDVNAAALGEHTWGAAQGMDTFIYLTVGTGIGGGGMVNGELLRGLTHPEMGHILVPHDREADPFKGSCPYHGDCLEGLASGPAIAARWGQQGEDLPVDHPAWALEANYLAYALANFTLTLSPQRIILGGGVMQRERLFPMIGSRLQSLLGDYVNSEWISENINEYLVPPALGNRAGVLGAIALAQRAANIGGATKSPKPEAS